MNYDTYKLATDRDDCTDMVTSCCGSEKETRYIKDEEVSICVSCSAPYPNMIEEYEYEENQKDFYTDL
jgi:hypothetical protein